MAWRRWSGRGVAARVAVIDGYGFPGSVRQRLGLAYPDLSAEDVRMVEDAARQWFRLAARRPSVPLSMPSTVVGAYWREFALRTYEYADFCAAALGRLLPYVPESAVSVANQPSGLWQTLLVAREEEVDSPYGLPLLFRVDRDLGVPGGRHYLADCGGRGECFDQAGMICLRHVDGVGRAVRRGWRIGNAPPPGDLGEGSISGGVGA